MPRSLNAPSQNPYGSFRKSFYDEGDDPRNPLQRFRDMYKNLNNSGGWTTKGLRAHAQGLKRRLGETEQQYGQREAEYQRRLRAGEDARSLLDSQLNESRLALGGLQKQFDHTRSLYDQDRSRWQEEQSEWGNARSRYDHLLEDFGRKVAEGDQARGLLDSQLNDSRSALEGFRKQYQEAQNGWDQERSQWGDERSWYDHLLKDVDRRYRQEHGEWQKKTGETQSMYDARIKDFERRLQEEQADHLSQMQSQSERFSELWDQGMEPFARLLKDIQPKKYEEIMSQASLSQGQQNPRFSQSSVYSQGAPQSFYQSIKSNYDWQARERQQKASDLAQMREQYAKDMAERQSLYDKTIQESGTFKKKSQGEITAREAELQRLRPLQTETEQLRAERNKLEDFRQKYWHVHLPDYDKHKEFYNTYKNMDFGSYHDLPEYFKPLDQFKTQYQKLANYDDHVREFMRKFPGSTEKEFHPKKPFDVPDYEASVPKSLAQLNDLRAFAQKNRGNYQEMMKRRHMMESYVNKGNNFYQAQNYGLQKLGLGNHNIPAQTTMNPYSWGKR